MTSADETEAEVKLLLKQRLPASEITRVDVRERTDSEGQPSFYIFVVFKTYPAKSELKQTNVLVDELRTWLSKKGDDRFPYLTFSTENDEKELRN